MTVPAPRRSWTARPPAELADPVRHDGGALPDELDFHAELENLHRIAPFALRELRDLGLLYRDGDTVESLCCRVGSCPNVLVAMLVARGYGHLLDRMRAAGRGGRDGAR